VTGCTVTPDGSAPLAVDGFVTADDGAGAGAEGLTG